MGKTNGGEVQSIRTLSKDCRVYPKERSLHRVYEWCISMRRGKPVHPRMYIEMRIEQLKQERTKSNDKMTRMWLWKCIDELRYVLQVMDKRSAE